MPHHGRVSARWRRITQLSTPAGLTASGWFKEEGHTASPWEWPGFEVVDEPASDHGGFFANVTQMVCAIRKEGPRPDETPFYDALRRMVDTNRDGQVTEEELDAVLRSRSKAAHIARIIARHDSEWSVATMGRACKVVLSIAEQLGFEAVKQVQDEMPRAEKLPWWDEVAATVDGFPKSPKVYHFHPGGLAAGFLRANAVRIEEARVRAFLRMIRIGEGTQGQRGYETLFGGSSFIRDHGRDFSDHPRIKIKRGPYVSSAAGAYQVMGYTWDNPGQAALRRRFAISDFSPASQDRYGVLLLRYKRSALDEIKTGRIRAAIEKCNKEWASLPGSPYGQPTVNWDRVLAEFDVYLKDELAGHSDLAVSMGALNDLID